MLKYVFALAFLFGAVQPAPAFINFRGGANSTVTSPLTDDAGNNLFDESGNQLSGH